VSVPNIFLEGRYVRSVISLKHLQRLEDWIGRWLKVWDGVGRREGHLLDLGEIVCGVLIQNKLADWTEGE